MSQVVAFTEDIRGSLAAQRPFADHGKDPPKDPLKIRRPDLAREAHTNAAFVAEHLSGQATCLP